MSNLVVAQLQRVDLPDVARLHAIAFPDAAITAFGLEVVCRYYEWLLEGPHDARLMGAWVDDQLAGFCAAGLFNGAMSGFLRQNRWYLARRVVQQPKLLASSLVRDRIRTALRITARFSRFATKGPIAAPQARAFGVLSIATDPAMRGAGVGRALMNEAETRARAAAFDRMILTVHPENGVAVRFYEQLGWARVPVGPSWNGTMEKRL